MTKPKDVITQIRKATRRKFSADEKIQIVLEGLCGEMLISEICRREGIAQFTIHDLRRSAITNWAQHLPIQVV